MEDLRRHDTDDDDEEEDGEVRQAEGGDKNKEEEKKEEEVAKEEEGEVTASVFIASDRVARASLLRRHRNQDDDEDDEDEDSVADDNSSNSSSMTRLLPRERRINGAVGEEEEEDDDEGIELDPIGDVHASSRRQESGGHHHHRHEDGRIIGGDVGVGVENGVDGYGEEREDEEDEDDDGGLVFDGTKLNVVRSGSGAAGEGHVLSNRRLCGLALYWLARSAWWSAFPIILLPLQVLTIAGDEYKGTAVGIITLVGAVLSLFTYPIIGILSDRTQVKKHHRLLPLGRRKPYMVVGIPLMSLAMLAFPFLEHRGVVWMVPYGVAYIAVSFFDSLGSAPYLALVPDIVSQKQFGVASGWLGLMSMLGNLLGGGILGIALSEITTYGAFAFLSLFQLICVLGTVLSVTERPSIIDVSAFSPHDEDSFSVPSRRRLLKLLDWIMEALRPFKDANFRWVFWTRFLFTAGFQIMIQYFMRDAVPRPYKFAGLSIEDPEAAVSFFVGMVTFGSILSALLAGYLSDKYGRKVVVYVSGGLMAAIPLSMVITNNFTIMILTGLIFGFAYGGYITVDFALASDVLPRSESHATDLGVWHISWVLPTMITPPVAGLMIDLLEPLSDSLGIDHMGYKSIFLLSSFLLFLAVILVKQIRVAKVEELGIGAEEDGTVGQELQTPMERRET